jgi:hypothetical protein
MPDFELRDGTRFADDFTLAPVSAYTPTAPESAYIRLLAALLDDIAAELAAEAAAPQGTALQPLIREDLQKLRSQVASALRRRAADFVTLPAGAPRDRSADEERERVAYYEGAYSERRRLILLRPFEVLPVPRDAAGAPVTPLQDIEIKTRDVAISEEQQRFKVDIDSARRVIRTVLSDTMRRGSQPSRWRWDTRLQQIRQRRHEYLLALLGIAQIGLMNVHPSQITFASLALKGLQQEFVDREAGPIKNAYVRRLGGWALGLVVAGLAGFFLFAWLDPDGVPFRFRRFCLLAAGAALGCWLSFSLRRVTLRFEDLAALEEDRLDPGIRVLFVALLTTVVGLLFWTQAIAVKLGDFSSDFRVNGAYALLIGALCGIAERGLATAVTRRAEDFAASVGGQR